MILRKLDRTKTRGHTAHHPPLKKKPQECSGVELLRQAREDSGKGLHTRKLLEGSGRKHQRGPSSTRRVFLGRESHLGLSQHRVEFATVGVVKRRLVLYILPDFHGRAADSRDSIQHHTSRLNRFFLLMLFMRKKTFEAATYISSNNLRRKPCL